MRPRACDQVRFRVVRLDEHVQLHSSLRVAASHLEARVDYRNPVHSQGTRKVLQRGQLLRRKCSGIQSEGVHFPSIFRIRVYYIQWDLVLVKQSNVFLEVLNVVIAPPALLIPLGPERMHFPSVNEPVVLLDNRVCVIVSNQNVHVNLTAREGEQNLRILLVLHFERIGRPE